MRKSALKKKQEQHATHAFFSTDFCLRDTQRDARHSPGIALPKFYMFNQIVRPEEFYLGENLNVPKRKTVAVRAAAKGPVERGEDEEETPKRPAPQRRLLPAVPSSRTIKVQAEVLTQAEYQNVEFTESSLRGYASSGASAYDHIRPLFDPSGFFPYNPRPQLQRRIVIRTSRLAFKTSYLEVPIQTIEGIRVYMALVRRSGDSGDVYKCVSNIVEVDMRLKETGKWRPSTFHEYDWIVDSTMEVSLYVEVVARVRCPSPTKPFELKDTLIANNEMEFLEYVKGEFRPVEPGPLKLKLKKNGEPFPEDQESMLTFVVSHVKAKYPGLPINFICPSDAIESYAAMRLYLMNLMFPFGGTFSKWCPQYIDPIIFHDICANDKLMHYFVTAWTDKTPAGLSKAVRKYYTGAHVTSKTGQYALIVAADTDERATTRVAQALMSGKMQADERLKPFHTDELRRALIFAPVAIFD